MNDQRRILLPIDLHGVSRGTLETLVRIARQLDRSLLGLLLVDLRLQQAADLPFTTEITLSGARERSLLRDHLSQRHSLVSRDTRQLLGELARRNSVQLTFEDAAGHRLHTALEREERLDIFFPPRQRWQLLSSASSIAPALIPRLGLVLPASGQAGPLLETAQTLLSAGLVGEVYVLSDHSPGTGQLQGLYRPGHRICVQSNFALNPLALAGLIRHSPYDLLLIPRDLLKAVPGATLDAALEKSGGQVLVVD
jgi:hypothetical protein